MASFEKYGPGLAALLSENETLSVEEACRSLGVSAATARRVFSRAAEQGHVVRFWGGIRRADTLFLRNQIPVSERQMQFPAEKKAIARAAADLVENGDVIIIDGGTTTVFMVEFLAGKSIQVITNSLLVAAAFDHHRAKSRGPEVLMTGGMLYQELGLLTGVQTCDNLKQYHASKAFISVGALNEAFATNHHPSIVESEKVMVSQAQKLILLSDHSKLNQTHMCTICPADQADFIISNRNDTSRSFFAKPAFSSVEVVLTPVSRS